MRARSWIGHCRVLSIWLKFDKHQITSIEATFRSFFICLMFEALLCAFKMLPDQCLHELALLQPFLKIWNTKQGQQQMSRIQYLKRRLPQRRMEACSIPILSKIEPLPLLLWTGMYKAPEICLNTPVYPFSLPIRLRMKGTAHTQLCACQIEEGLPKVTSENMVPDSQSEIMVWGIP